MVTFSDYTGYLHAIYIEAYDLEDILGGIKESMYDINENKCPGNSYQVEVQELPVGMYQIILLLEDGERLVKPFIKAGQ